MEYLQYFAQKSKLLSSVNVLNLVISGIPSILDTMRVRELKTTKQVLNLVISGIPSILYQIFLYEKHLVLVLNLVISGIPSIQRGYKYYNSQAYVLNLVISGIPSILAMSSMTTKDYIILGFKPCYKWNTFNTLV